MINRIDLGLTFTRRVWNSARVGHDNIIHKVTRIGLRADNHNNIPDGFEFTAPCGASNTDAFINFEPSHVLYPEIFTEGNDMLEKCEVCFPEPEGGGK